MSQHIPRVVTVTLFVVLLFGFTHGPVAAQTDDTAAIRKLVEQFFSAYAKEDIEGLMSLWSQDSTELTASKQSFQKVQLHAAPTERDKLGIWAINMLLLRSKNPRYR